MTTRNLLITITIVFILAIFGTSLWLFEILKIKGWYGLNWLNGPLYSSYIATLVAVFAFLTPFIISRQMTVKKITCLSIILYAASILCFETGKGLCYALYCRFCFWTRKDILLNYLIAFLLFVFIGVAYWFVTNRWIKKNKKVNILLITFLIVSAIPLSLMTIQLNTGFGTQAEWVDAVKMGYPIFWTIVLLGLSAILVVRQKNYPDRGAAA
jgi:hypothetical protein